MTLESKFGLEAPADKKTVDVKGDLAIHVWVCNDKRKILDADAQSIVFVEDKANKKINHVEIFYHKLTEEQVKEAITKFNQDPNSFNNQL